MSSSHSNIRRRAIMASTAAAAATTTTTKTMHISSSRIVASALDWHCKRLGGGSCILNLRITRHWLDLAICSHPALQQKQQPEEEDEMREIMTMVQQLPSIPLVMKKQTRATQLTDNNYDDDDVKHHQHQQSAKVLLQNAGMAQELASIVQRHNVCGTLVSWPVQPGGWLGSQCGRVLFTLDQIAQQQHEQQLQEEEEQDSRGCINSHLGVAVPLCLWDDLHFQQPEDTWGRAAIYAHGSTCQEQQEHLASVEQYRDRNDTVAAHVWKDFCRVHWPELYQYQQHKMEHGKQTKQQQQQQQHGTITPLVGGGVGDWNVKSSQRPKATLLAATTATAPGNNPWLARKGEDRMI